jgi:hypothetical protein
MLEYLVAVPQQSAEQADIRLTPRRFTTLATFLGAVCFIFTLLFLKRPDALLAAQFFAEDGRIFFHDQILFGGWEALFMPYAGYLLFVPRFVAMLASWFPIELAPTVYNTAALLIAAVCCSLFCLPAFRWILASDVLRFAVCCLVATALDSGELAGTITQIQWYLQFGGILLVLYRSRRDAPHNLWLDALLAVLLFVITMSVPTMILVVPLALWMVLRAPGTAKLPAGALLAAMPIQLWVYANAGILRGQNALFSFHSLLGSTGVYLAFRAVLSSTIGRPRAALQCARGAFVPSLLIGIAVLLWMIWLWRKADWQTRWNVLGCLYFAAGSALLAVGARNLPRSPITFGGERYFYLSSACLVLLIAITIERFAWNRWIKAAVLTAMFSAGVWANFRVPAYADFHWRLYCEQISRWQQDAAADVGVRAISMPLNPLGWTLILEGNILTNGGFEEVYPTPWVGLGNIGMAVTRDFHYHGRGSLVMSGTEGDVRQLVWGLRPGDNMRAQAAVLMPCKAGLAASLLIEDGLGTAIAGTTSNALFSCGSWRQLKVGFQVSSSRRVLIRLQYKGAGQSILWDDVELVNE